MLGVPLVLIALGCQAGFDVESRSQGIVGGDVHTEDPAVVLLDLGGALCTGTLISPRVVLTAAHCLKNEASSIRVMFVNQMGGSGDVISAVSYENKEGTDLGALTLASDGPVEPIPPNPYSLTGRIGEPVKIIGFGVTGETSQDSGVKRMGMASLNALSGDGVKTGELTTTNDPQGTCYGDSGGPNMMTIDGVEYVAGVTSRGTDICGAGLDVAVRVDSHISWIRQYIADNDPSECVSDGVCVEECGETDIDCVGDSTNAGGAVADNVVGACSASGQGTGWWFLVLGALVGIRRKKKRLGESRVDTRNAVRR